MPSARSTTIRSSSATSVRRAEGSSASRRSARRSRSYPHSSDRSSPRLDDVAAFQQSWLRSSERPRARGSGTIRAADLFCGVGGLSVGLEEATWGLGLEVDHRLAADLDRGLLDCFQASFGADRIVDQPIETVLDGELGAIETSAERDSPSPGRRAGPRARGPSLPGPLRPQQPHPPRRPAQRPLRPNDPCCRGLRPAPSADRERPRRRPRQERCRRESARSSREAWLLRRFRRRPRRGGRRAPKTPPVLPPRIPRAPAVDPDGDRSIAQVASIGRLGTRGSRCFGRRRLRRSANHSAENRRRIAYLFEHDLYELPDSERPPCHRDKAHSYRSVYGRMRADEPAPTITVGFGSTGQGRFVHPTEPRTLTPHEAARVQTFPDWFDFGGLGRRQLQKAIGNAVPPMLASVVLRELLLGDLL